jgi:hypothetical protein
MVSALRGSGSRLLTAAILLLLFYSLPAGGDDGAVEIVGGTIQLMGEHPTVEMAAEEVRVDLSLEQAEVDCLFTLKNTGPATTVRIGFPEGGGQLPVFTSFATWVDGKPVPVRIENIDPRKPSLGRWRMKQVYFGAGKTRLIRVQYQTPLTWAVGNQRVFEYLLYTGASWKGPIGKAEVIVRLMEYLPYRQVLALPAGYERQGNKLIWRWTNLEPKRNDHEVTSQSPGEVSVSFSPAPQVIINGQNGYSYSLAEKLIDSELWVPASFFDAWGSSAHTGGQDVRGQQAAGGGRIIRFGERIMLLKPGSLQVVVGSKIKEEAEVFIVDGQPKLLSHAPYYDKKYDDDLLVPVNEVVELLGGSARFDQKTGVTYLTAPHPATLTFYENGKWQTAGREELIKGANAGAKEQSWRRDPVKVLEKEVMGLLPEEFRRDGGATIQVERQAGDPSGLRISKGERIATCWVYEGDDYARLFRLKVKGSDKETIIKLEKPFGNWWYITEIRSPKV